MAGIGFELKKMFAQKGVLKYLSACFQSAIVIAGPLIMCMFFMLFIRVFLQNYGFFVESIDLINSIILYSFIISLVFSSGFNFFSSRYVSDLIFSDKFSKIKPCLYGTIIIVASVTSIFTILFYIFSPLPLPYKFLGYFITVTLSILWVQMSFLSAARNYTILLKIFLFGIFFALALIYIMSLIPNFLSVGNTLLAILIGFLTITSLFSVYLSKFFKGSSGGLLDFISFIDVYPETFFIGLILTINSFLHNILFWFSDYKMAVNGAFLICPIYDIPMFLATLSIIPTQIMFVISFETTFYAKYRQFFSAVLDGGNIEKIKTSKKEMIQSLFRELTYLFEIQIFITVLLIPVGIKFLPSLGLSMLSIDIYIVVLLGIACYGFHYTIVLILLYFDDRKGVLRLVFLFTILSFSLTIISLLLGEEYFGVGYFIASLICALYSLKYIIDFTNNLNYYIFLKQPLVTLEKNKATSIIKKIILYFQKSSKSGVKSE